MTLAVRYLYISLLLLTGCVSNENQYQGYIFGTYYNIKISDSPNLNTLQSSIDFKLREIDMLFSNYKSESYLMKFNRKEKQATNDDFTNWDFQLDSIVCRWNGIHQRKHHFRSDC